jgi:hypothetical protein
MTPSSAMKTGERMIVEVGAADVVSPLRKTMTLCRPDISLVINSV